MMENWTTCGILIGSTRKSRAGRLTCLPSCLGFKTLLEHALCHDSKFSFSAATFHVFFCQMDNIKSILSIAARSFCTCADVVKIQFLI